MEFIDSYEVGRSIKVYLLVAYVLHLALLVVVYVLYTKHNNDTVQSYDNVTHESLKIGEIQAILSFILSYEDKGLNALSKHDIP